MKSPTRSSDQTSQRLAECIAANTQSASSDPAFASWLENEYVPIAGGWQY